jgi:hypothetical protein
MRIRHISLAAGVAVAAWLALSGNTAPVDSIAEPVTRAAVGVQTRVSHVKALARGAQDGHESVISNLLPRDSLIGHGETAQPEDALFKSRSWTPAPPPPPKPPTPPPPTAPALPFTYLGKKLEGDIWEVYLARGEQTFIARAETVIEGTYRVQSIHPSTLSVIYLPLNQMQTLTIGATE